MQISLPSLAALGVVTATPLHAQISANQSTGTVSGRVLNRGTGASLRGAEVRVSGTDRVAYTDENGRFQLSNVTPGDVKLDVPYSGLDSASLVVPVAAGAVTTHEVALTNAAYAAAGATKLADFAVASEKEGKAAALTQQRQADNMVNVISSDKFPNVGGGSVGEFLRNIPGVVVDYSNADPRSVRVHGFDPNLNSVSVDGMRSANAVVVVAANDYTFYPAQPQTQINWAPGPMALGIAREDPKSVYPASLSTSYNANYTRRKSLSANFGFRLDQHTTAFLNNQIKTYYIRARGRGLRLNEPAPSATLTTTTNVTLRGYSDVSAASTGDINGTTITSADRASGSFAQLSSGDVLNKKGAGSPFSGGMKHNFGAWKIDYSAGASLSSNHHHLGGPREEGETFGRANFYLRCISFKLHTRAYSHRPTVAQLAGPTFTTSRTT